MNSKHHPITKKKNHKGKNDSIQKYYNEKFAPQLFVSPIACHRIYRDFLVPDINFTTGLPLHHYQNYLFYKNLSQVHIRNLGVVFELVDKTIDYITPLGLLQTRLDSIGNKFAHELAEFLPLYYESFENNSILESNEEKIDIVCEEKAEISDLEILNMVEKYRNKF